MFIHLFIHSFFTDDLIIFDFMSHEKVVISVMQHYSHSGLKLHTPTLVANLYKNKVYMKSHKENCAHNITLCKYLTKLMNA